MPIFNKTEWLEKIEDPHWYLSVPLLMKELGKLHDTDKPAYERTRDEIYGFFEQQLGLDKIALGKKGKNFDIERKPIDTIIIHHTSMQPGLGKDRLSAINLYRLYAPQYASPSYNVDRRIKTVPVFSGHFRDGVQVFWPYHWMIHTDGTVEQLLRDEEIGWHAGNWQVNCRSVAIAFDNDYEDSEPSEKEMRAFAKLVKEKYPLIEKTNIKGHCEVNTKTTCPSKHFGSKDNHSGWKDKLLGMI